ncbi:hypothetical protein BC830DRAFT_1147822 [Chytriomyces sp. MP71]|nr:hypothetical protein BC830DRAFT_1147822 [Chytriomyces sp. MP71]
MNAVTTYEAVVLGATGAIGRELTSQLVASPACGRVTAFTRRELGPEARQSLFGKHSAESDKLRVQTVDYNALKETDFRSEKGVAADVVFCCLGTTRADAGSAEAFRKVDFDHVVDSAKTARTLGVPYFGLVTSGGSDKNSFFLYPRTKGEVEEAVQGMGFTRLSIFRPGLLDRAGESRTWEWLANKVMPGVAMQVIARAMIRDYESKVGEKREFNDAQIRDLGK